MNARSKDYSYQFNQSGKLVLDVSLWDRVTIHAIAPVVGTVYVYGSNDGGSFQDSQYGNATLATNFVPIQATNLATGSSVSSIISEGAYAVNIYTKYLQLAGGGASIYGLIVEQQRIY